MGQQALNIGSSDSPGGKTVEVGNDFKIAIFGLYGGRKSPIGVGGFGHIKGGFEGCAQQAHLHIGQWLIEFGGDGACGAARRLVDDAMLLKTEAELVKDLTLIIGFIPI
jgi:hypothetical protein